MPKIVTATTPEAPMSRLDFLKLLTFPEKVAIETAASTDPEVRVIKNTMMAADIIKLDDPEMIAGLDMYVSKDLITKERQVEILGG